MPVTAAADGRALVVDAMNVVGSRPTGWWRDRDGAVRDLAGRLRRYVAATGRDVTLVVDGHPIDGLPEGTCGRLEVRYAHRRGPDAADDRIVELLDERGGDERDEPVTVVTADRALRERAGARGATVQGPRTLLDGLDEVDRLRDHLVATRLAGDVATSPGETRRNCGRLVDGLVDYTFGLPDWRDADQDEVEAAVGACCGDGAVGDRWDVPGRIDPDATLAAIGHHAARLAAHAAAGSRVLLATGHPTGLLGHYVEVAAALDRAGCELLRPCDDEWLVEDGDARSGVRYLLGVGCVWNGGNLVHTHRSVYMEALLDACAEAATPPDLVVSDHGMAGAAIARGIETLSIADVNDPALPLAAARGRTDGVLVLDDNLAPEAFRPVTAAIVRRLP